MITGADVKRLRERRGWSQKDLGAALNAALGRNYSSGSISPWEQDKRAVPADVAAFIEELLIDTALPGDDPPPTSTPLDEGGAGDSAPGGGSQPAQPPLTTGGHWTRACTELWEMIGAGVGMVGGATGSQAMMVDGAIIVADSPALGAAWAKLAETNETFRKMLLSMTEGGAWLQVCLVTGTTFSKCYNNHAERALMARAGGPDDDGPAGVREPVAA